MNRLKISQAIITRIIILLILYWSSALSQLSAEEHRKPDQSDFATFNPITFETITYWVDDTTSVRLILPYRLDHKFFFFVKSDDVQQEYYEAKGELGIEILDDKDVTVVRDFRQVKMISNSMPNEGKAQAYDQEGYFIFTLKKGAYRAILEAKDYASEKSYTNRDIQINAQLKFPGLNISTAIFAKSLFNDTSMTHQKKYLMMNNGGSVYLGERGGCLFQLVSSDTTTATHLSWEMRSRYEIEGMDTLNFHGSLYYKETGIPAAAADGGHIIFTATIDYKKSEIIYIPLPIERLETGPYSLTITVAHDSIKSDKRFKFNVIWPNMPHSLNNLNLAIDALKHIATEKEIDQMIRMNFSKSNKVFHEFWQKQNPDTSSAYNSRMAEYYRRVDETIKRFSTEEELDGYKTDRGRIYILFGSPSIMNRLLKPDSPPTEIWTYEKLRERYIFVDRQKNGNYILEKEEKY